MIKSRSSKNWELPVASKVNSVIQLSGQQSDKTRNELLEGWAAGHQRILSPDVSPDF